MRALLRYLGCLVLLITVASCQEDPQSAPPQDDKFKVTYWLDSTYSRTVHLHLTLPKGVNYLSMFWDFGDGTTVRTATDTSMVHTYKIVGDYRVRVATDQTDTPRYQDSTLVVLKSRYSKFALRATIDQTTYGLVHFSLEYPKGFNHDSLYWDFGDGERQWRKNDTSLTHLYQGPDIYRIKVSSDPSNQSAVADSAQCDLTAKTALYQLKLFNSVKLTFASPSAYLYTQLGPQTYTTVGKWTDSILTTSTADESIVVGFRPDGSLDLTEHYGYGTDQWVEWQDYRAIQIYCLSSTEQRAVYRINSKACVKKIKSYSYARYWNGGGGNLRFDTPPPMDFISLEFYNR